MNSFSQVPPGFRFHPTDEELVDYYLRKKVASRRIDLDVIKDIDLYKIEPWDLQEKCKIGTEEQNEWYFFSHKDKKYPTGTRTNRATTAGFWKATGRDKAIYSKHNLIGMRKTLVFYKGRAPNGQKSDWIMHEYRLETNENGTPQEEGWVVCRVFKKRMTAVQRASEHGSPSWCDDQLSFMPEPDSPKRLHPADHGGYHQEFSCKQELDLHKYVTPHHENYFQLPHLESPKPPTSATAVSCNSLSAYALDINHGSNLQSSSLTQEGNIQNNHRGHELISPFYSNASEQAVDQVTDWRVLHKFVASQLSQDDVSKEPCNYSSSAHHVLQASENLQLLIRQTDKPDAAAEYASTSTSSCQIDPWK